MKTEIYIPIWEKANLSLEEASAYFGVGIDKMRNLTLEENCDWVIWVGGRHRLVKRKKAEEFFLNQYSI